MKKSLLFLSLCLAVVSAQATVIQVDNNAGAAAKYTLLQKAIDDANGGDTIYISGSPNYYDATTIKLNKKLVLIGPGYFLGENNQTQSSNLTAKIYGMEVGQGADNSVITGLTFDNQALSLSKKDYSGSTGTNPATNVTIRRNMIKSLVLNFVSGTLIEQNYFLNNSSHIYLAKTTSNTLIQNNLLLGNASFSTEPCVYGDPGYALTNTVIRNNTLSKNLSNLNGIKIENNIFIAGFLEDCDNNTLKNNVFSSSQVVSIPSNSTGNTYDGYNNKFTATASDLFVAASPKTDKDFILKANSPAAGAGIDGIDAGAFGGLNAYKLSGLPPIPSIYEVTTTGVGTKENGLKVVIKAKSNN